MNVGPRATEVAAGPTVDRSGVLVEDTSHRGYVRPADGGPDPSACAANGWEPGLHLPPGGRQTPTELVAHGTTYHCPGVLPAGALVSRIARSRCCLPFDTPAPGAGYSG